MKMGKKVAFVISSLNEGGAQRILSNMVTNFPDDWEIDIILNDISNIVFPYKGRLIDLGVLPVKNRQNIFYQIYVFLLRVIRLRKLKKKKKYTAVISFMDSANIANVVSGKQYCKVLLSVHCIFLHLKRRKYIDILLIRL